MSKVSLEATMMTRIGELKAEVERLTELNATLWKTFWFGFGFACFLFFLFILGIFIIFWKKTLP